jgi:hypothetical protein
MHQFSIIIDENYIFNNLFVIVFKILLRYLLNIYIFNNCYSNKFNSLLMLKLIYLMNMITVYFKFLYLN